MIGKIDEEDGVLGRRKVLITSPHRFLRIEIMGSLIGGRGMRIKPKEKKTDQPIRLLPLWAREFR